MKMSKLYMPTLREVPAEAELPSHQLLLRAGMIRKLSSGVYSYLPLGYRVFKNIEKIVREEMDKAGSQEVHMSALQPQELWEESGRWEQLGPEMFRLQDRNNRGFCLGPTHEEIFTDLVKNELRSYKQLPLNLYQIQTKFRDEKRPRYGLLRTREFSMKDAYSFDKDEAGMMEAYGIMWKAYEKVFDRCGLNYRVVEGDAGAMGDGDSHEFTAISEYGESNIIYCPACQYAATDEKAKCDFSVDATEVGLGIVEKIYTPKVKTIDELVGFLQAKPNEFVKTLIYRAKDEVVAILIPGDRTLNEIKLMKYLGISEQELRLAEADVIERVTGASVGFAGPVGLKEKIRVVIDSRVTVMKNMIVGANETDHHLVHVNYGRDFEGEVVEDLLLTVAGDGCPTCGKTLSMDKGIEVGNIFQLGTKYSERMTATFLNEEGKEKLFWMGSYGIGISRTMAAIVEQFYDEKGIKWPIAVAPYQVVVIPVNIKDEAQRQLAEKLYADLQAGGYEVLIDDRKERPGVKFADADLIGIPLKMIIGRKASEGILEFSYRHEDEKSEVSFDEALLRVKQYNQLNPIQ